jgi:hypothetical protein
MISAAIILIVVIAIAHSFLGERNIIARLLRRSDLPKLFGNDRFTRGTLRFAWHMTTVAWLGFAVLLAILMAQEPLSPAQILPVIAGVFALTGALAAVFTRGRHLSWIIFFAIAGLSLLPIICQ